jgi:hypothetical protein
MESSIERATTSEKILVLLGLIFSASGFVWLTLVPGAPPTSHMFSRLGFVAAIFACLWLAMLCWTLCFVYMGRKRAWSLRPAVALLILAGAAWFFYFLGTSTAPAGALGAGQAAWIPMLARKLDSL